MFHTYHARGRRAYRLAILRLPRPLALRSLSAQSALFFPSRFSVDKSPCLSIIHVCSLQALFSFFLYPFLHSTPSYNCFPLSPARIVRRVASPGTIGNVMEVMEDLRTRWTVIGRDGDTSLEVRGLPRKKVEASGSPQLSNSSPHALHTESLDSTTCSTFLAFST